MKRSEGKKPVDLGGGGRADSREKVPSYLSEESRNGRRGHRRNRGDGRKKAVFLRERQQGEGVFSYCQGEQYIGKFLKNRNFVGSGKEVAGGGGWGGYKREIKNILSKKKAYHPLRKGGKTPLGRAMQKEAVTKAIHRGRDGFLFL